MTAHLKVFTVTQEQLSTASYRQLDNLRKQSYARLTCGCRRHCGDDVLSLADIQENKRRQAITDMIVAELQKRFPNGDPHPPKEKQRTKAEKKSMRY